MADTDKTLPSAEELSVQPQPTEPKEKHLGGRPPKLTEEERAEVLEAFKLYIQNENDPTIVGFCAWDSVAIQYSITKDNLYDWEEFSELRKRAIEKQEAYLIKNAGSNTYNPTIAIFRLKQPQHGYKDRIDSDITSGGEKLEVGLSASQTDQLLRARALRESSDI